MSNSKKISSNNQMKVLYSSPSVSRIYTGVYEVSRNLALELNKSNIIVDIHSLVDAHTHSDLDSWSPIIPNVHNVLGPKAIGYSLTYLDALVASNASLGHIHALWSYTSYALFKWSQMTGRGYLFSANGYLDPWALSNSGLKKNIAMRLGFRSVLENASCIQVNSSLELDSVRLLGLKNPTCMISNGVNLPDLDQNQDAPWICESSERKVLLYIGRIDKIKGVDLLLKAWELIVKSRKNKDWHLVIVGFKNDNSKQEELLKSFIKENGLKNDVTCLEGQYGKNMEACYRNCDAFILPSFSEGASIAVLNAWAFSKPVLVTDECGFPDAAINGCALKIEPTISSIKLGIVSCIEMNQDERKSMGKKGLNLVTKKYSWTVVAKEISKVYRWILSNDHDRPDSLIN